MPRKYIRKTQRGAYGSEAIQAALGDLANGMSLKRAAANHQIDRRTLRRHRDNKVANPGQVHLGRFRPQISAAFEDALCSKIKTMEAMLFGLTTIDVRRLAYDLAESLGLPHRFNKTTRLAGIDWLTNFLHRNPTLAIRRPEAVSLSRAIGFNKAQVNRFYECLRTTLNKSDYTGSRLWNMDETGISSVQKPTKILAEKGKRGVGKITSAERGKNVTAICAFNAAGTYVPPMLIFPRKRWDRNLMKGAPVDAIGTCTDNGWSDSERFMQWLEHFVSHNKPSKEEPHIIILDGHHSHKTLQAIEYAEANGIELITLPPHCTHRLQPCDLTFFKPLKSAYNSFCDAWMLSHPGQRITFYEIASIFGDAYNKTATIGTAVKGFSTSGIWPFNDLLFNDEDFLASQVTDEPCPYPVVASETPSSSGNGSSPGPSPFAVDNDVQPSTSSKLSKTGLPAEPQEIIETICKTPKSQAQRKRTRKAEKSEILTSPVFKARLLEKTGPGKKKSVTPKLVKGKGKGKSTKQRSPPSSSDEEEWPCLVCGEDFSNSRPGEKWVQCRGPCNKWAHEECTPGMGLYLCQNCDSDSD